MSTQESDKNTHRFTIQIKNIIFEKENETHASH